MVGSVLGGDAPLGACCAGLSFIFPCALAQCPVNAYNALVKRHLTQPVNVCKERFTNVFLTHLKKPFRQAYNDALVTDIGDDAKWTIGRGRAKLAMIQKSKLFDNIKLTKARSMIKFEIGTKIPKKARAIQAHVNEATAYHYPAEYQALNAALKAVGKHTFVHNGTQYTLQYAGGLSHDELSDLFTSWCQEGKHYLDECDGANWDSTMQAPTLNAEMLVYEMVNARAALDVQVRNNFVRGKLFCKDYLSRRLFKIKYTTRYKRLSGDFNTSLGNSIISEIICFEVISNLPDHLRPKKVFALFMGDDYLAIYVYDELPDPHDLKAALNAGWASMGVTPERGIFDDPLAVTFISLGVWPRRGGGYQFVPMLARQLAKLMWTTKRATPQRARSIANGISQAFWPVYFGMPLMMKFLKAHYQPGSASEKWDHYFADMLTTNDRQVDWMRGMVEKYGVPLTAATFELPTSGLITSVLGHPLFDHMLAYENTDPDKRNRTLA